MRLGKGTREFERLDVVFGRRHAYTNVFDFHGFLELLIAPVYTQASAGT